MNAVRFKGTGESCAAVLALYGGPDPTKCIWKGCTYDGGFMVTPNGVVEFVKGDWIVKDDDGGLYVLTDSFGYADRKSGSMRDLVVAWLAAEVSEERVCEVSGLDRQGVRKIRDHLVERGMRAAGMNPPDESAKEKP